MKVATNQDEIKKPPRIKTACYELTKIRDEKKKFNAHCKRLEKKPQKPVS